MDIGFIGAGNIGFPIVRRLIGAGHRLFVHDLNPIPLKRLQAEGATIVPSPAQVAHSAELVMASLPTPQSVHLIVSGKEGLVNGSKIKCFVDLSTTGPTVAKQVAAELESRGIVQLDAPVSGGARGAEAGTLAVMVSGKRKQFEACEPVLRALGRVFYVGEEPGLGQTMKLVNNYLSAAVLALTAEATVMGVKSGLDPEKMIEVLNSGSGRNGATVDKFPKSVLTGTFDYGFSAGLMYKDVSLFAQEAEKLGSPTWIGTMVRQMWQFTCSQLGPDADFTRIVQINEQWAGVQVRARRSIKAPTAVQG